VARERLTLDASAAAVRDAAVRDAASCAEAAHAPAPAAAPRAGVAAPPEAPPQQGHFTVIGTNYPKVDGLAKAQGATRYADDLSFPRMLYGRLLRSPHQHARVKSIDVSAAKELPGVIAILVGKDLPVNYGIMPTAEDEHALAIDKVRHVGDAVVAVAALDEETAEAATRLIRVEYDQLPSFMSIEEAMQKPGDSIHPSRRGNNVHRVVSLEFGDVEAGLGEAEYVREDVFFYEGNTHLPMEEHSAVAVPEPGGRVTLYSATQTPHYVHRAVAKVLEVPMERVRVVAQPVGGGFGGKTDPFSHEICACKLALMTGRPVKFTLSREEVFYAHRGRHPVLMRVKTGVRRDGTITGMDWESHLDGGAYGSYGPASTYYTGCLQPVTYAIPHYRFRATRMFTNKPPCGPKRGHGTPQPRFAIEVHLDRIAEDLGIDPAEIRRRNFVKPYTWSVNHMRITSCGLRECLDKVIEASGYDRLHGKLPRGKGMGLAIGTYICGAGLPIYWNDLPHSEAVVRADRGGGVTCYTGAIDIGQGSNTVHAAIVAEVLGLSPEQIHLVCADTDLSPLDLGSYSSRVTFMSGNAALEAARGLRALLTRALSESLGWPADDIRFVAGQVYPEGRPDEALSFPEACYKAEAVVGTLSAAGSYKPPKVAGPYKGSGVGPSPAYSYAAAVVLVDCDEETGEVKIEKVWMAHDIGRAISPVLVEGQVEGSVYMGLCEALMEESAFRKGLHKIPSMLDYKTFTTMEMPPVETILVETEELEGPFGAKEAGQGPLLPVPPAVANAVHDALGVWIHEVPITPDKVLKALDSKDRFCGPTAVPKFAFPEPIRVARPPEWEQGGAGKKVGD
jgi:4-hydroxybenzoyl-CoA reductase subunit alpha